MPPKPFDVVVTGTGDRFALEIVSREDGGPLVAFCISPEGHRDTTLLLDAAEIKALNTQLNLVMRELRKIQGQLDKLQREKEEKGPAPSNPTIDE